MICPLSGPSIPPHESPSYPSFFLFPYLSLSAFYIIIFFYIEVKEEGGIERVIEGENGGENEGGIEGRIQ
jgi:hypothetical protein